MLNLNNSIISTIKTRESKPYISGKIAVYTSYKPVYVKKANKKARLNNTYTYKVMLNTIEEEQADVIRELFGVKEEDEKMRQANSNEQLFEALKNKTLFNEPKDEEEESEQERFYSLLEFIDTRTEEEKENFWKKVEEEEKEKEENEEEEKEEEKKEKE